MNFNGDKSSDQSEPLSDSICKRCIRLLHVVLRQNVVLSPVLAHLPGQTNAYRYLRCYGHCRHIPSGSIIYLDLPMSARVCLLDVDVSSRRLQRFQAYAQHISCYEHFHRHPYNITSNPRTKAISSATKPEDWTCCCIFLGIWVSISRFQSRKELKHKHRCWNMWLTFGSGFYSVCVCSVLRIIAISLAPLMYYPSWAGQPISLWTSIEANLALICSSLPILRPLAVRLWRRFRPLNKDRFSMSYFSEKIWSRSSDRSTSSASDANRQSDQNTSNDGSSNSSGSKGIMVHTSYQISTADNERVNSLR